MTLSGTYAGLLLQSWGLCLSTGWSNNYLNFSVLVWLVWFGWLGRTSWFGLKMDPLTRSHTLLRPFWNIHGHVCERVGTVYVL